MSEEDRKHGLPPHVGYPYGADFHYGYMRPPLNHGHFQPLRPPFPVMPWRREEIHYTAEEINHLLDYVQGIKVDVEQHINIINLPQEYGALADGVLRRVSQNAGLDGHGYELSDWLDYAADDTGEELLARIDYGTYVTFDTPAGDWETWQFNYMPQDGIINVKVRVDAANWTRVLTAAQDKVVLYDTTGNNTDGAMTQDAVTKALQQIGGGGGGAPAEEQLFEFPAWVTKLKAGKTYNSNEITQLGGDVAALRANLETKKAWYITKKGKAGVTFAFPTSADVDIFEADHQIRVHWAEFDGIVASEKEVYIFDDDSILLKPSAGGEVAFADDLDRFVEKEDGKGLSANDYTNADMIKLAGLNADRANNAQRTKVVDSIEAMKAIDDAIDGDICIVPVVDVSGYTEFKLKDLKVGDKLDVLAIKETTYPPLEQNELIDLGNCYIKYEKSNGILQVEIDHATYNVYNSTNGTWDSRAVSEANIALKTRTLRVGANSWVDESDFVFAALYRQDVGDTYERINGTWVQRTFTAKTLPATITEFLQTVAVKQTDAEAFGSTLIRDANSNRPPHTVWYWVGVNTEYTAGKHSSITVMLIGCFDVGQLNQGKLMTNSTSKANPVCTITYTGADVSTAVIGSWE